MSSSFTFLNATGAPTLSTVEAKRRRGHITKLNFASRRERKAENRIRNPHTKIVTSQDERKDDLQTLDSLGLAVALSTATSRTDPHHSAQLLIEFWRLLFLDGGGWSGRPNNLEWLNIHASEPALVEATMAIALRYWSPDALCKSRAELHSYRALRMIMQRIESKQTHTEGFILTALVMAMGERLMQNDAGWQIHMNGIIQAIKERQSRHLLSFPPILTNLLILDSTNNAFDYPRMFHRKVIDLAVDPNDRILSIMEIMSKDLYLVRKWVNAHANKRSSPGNDPPDIEALWVKSYIKCKIQEGHSNPFVRATLKASQIILYLSSPPGADQSRIPTAADELRHEMSQLPGRSCWCMELTSCQIMVGAIASARGSATRAWFIDKLKTGVDTMRNRGWENAFGFLERALAADEDMLSRLRALWKEETEVV